MAMMNYPGQAVGSNGPTEGRLETFISLEADVGFLHTIVAENKSPPKGSWAPLHYACYAGSLDMVQAIAEKKRMPIDYKNINKNTALHVASYRGFVDICMYLMQKGASPKTKDKDGWSSLHYACYGGHPEVVTEMLRRGAKIKETSRIGWSPLHCASIAGRIEVAQVLFSKGSRSTNDKDVLRNTPLHYACGSGHLQMAQFLLDKGAGVDYTNIIKQTPLHLACLTANVQLIQILIKHGADINAKDDEKRAPLHYSSERGHMEITSILTAQGADVNIKDRSEWTPLHFSFSAGFVRHSILLLSKGADFGAKDKRGCIPLAVSLNNRLDTFHLEFIFGNMAMEPSHVPVALDKLNQLVKMHKSADFSKAGLYGFPPGLAFASFLQQLDLSENRIHIYPTNLSSFTSLRKLSLSHNNLHSLPDHVTALPALSSLDLSNNLLSDLSPAILHMKALEELNLSHNKFLMLPTFLAGMPNLNLILEGNLLTCIPPQIRNKEYKDIFVYLKQLKEGSAIWGRLKLMLVGQEGVGKTSLLHALQKKSKSDVTQLLSTDGIEISSFVAHKVQFRAWDFGGQLVFYPTHQFFLTRGCVYLVLFDLTKPNTLERVEYWLQQLKVLTFEDPLAITALVIGTHADKEGAISIEEAHRRFHMKFPFVKGYADISNKSSKKHIGISPVVDKLLDLSKDDKTFSSIVPESYILLEGKLMQMVNSGMDYVEWSHYSQVGQSCGIHPDDLPFVTRFLHDAGVLLHFQGTQTKSVFWESGASKVKHLGGVVILNPQWLANVMASIVTFSHTWIKAGILLHSDLTQVWRTKYSPDLWNLLLNLLEEFEVLYPLQSPDIYSRKYLVPSLLPSLKVTEPPPLEVVQFEVMWRKNPQFNHRRVYSWDTMPVGYFPRLLLRLAHVSSHWSQGSENPTRRDGTLRGAGNMGSNNNSGPWLDGVILSHGAHFVFLRYIEGSEGDQAPAPKGSFHLEMRVTKDPSISPEEELAPMLAQISHTICALKDTAYRPYKCYNSIYCPLCLFKTNSHGHSFTYKECMDSMLQGTALHCAMCDKDVAIADMAPDIAFANVPHISANDLTIKDVIGQGGFGKVYKGALTTPEGVRDVAIKEAFGLEYEEDFQMLQHEVFLMSAIKHPNLVLFYGIAQQPTMQIVMEFVPGTDLNKLLFTNAEKNIQMPIEWQLRVAYDIACSMNYLHTLSPPITHRDLRSPNVLILNNEPASAIMAKVIDLGLAQQLAPHTYGGLETWQWMAPETILPGVRTAYNEKCDVYSFAIVIWEVVAQGKLPFEEYINDQVMAVKERIVKEGLRPIIPPECPPDFGRLIYDCWQGDPNVRPSFYQILFVLEKMLLARGLDMSNFESNAMVHSNSANNGVRQATSSRDVRLGAMREVRTAPPQQVEGEERERQRESNGHHLAHISSGKDHHQFRSMSVVNM